MTALATTTTTTTQEAEEGRAAPAHAVVSMGDDGVDEEVDEEVGERPAPSTTSNNNPGGGGGGGEIRGVVIGLLVTDVLALVCWIFALFPILIMWWITLLAFFVSFVLACIVIPCKMKNKNVGTLNASASESALVDVKGRRRRSGVFVSHLMTLVFWSITVATSAGERYCDRLVMAKNRGG